MKQCTIRQLGNKKYYCSFELALQLIGGKWKAIILYHLGRKEVLRFGELKKAMPNTTEKMLTQQLRELEADNIINRKVYRQVPPKVEYSLTSFGTTIIPILTDLKEWGNRYEKKFTTESVK